MNGEEKYLNLKGDLKYNIDGFRDTMQKRAHAAKCSIPIVTVILLLLLLVKSTDKVEILFWWVGAMLVIAAYLILLEYFEKVWLDGLDEMSDRYDYYIDDEVEDEDEDEEYEYEDEEGEILAASEKEVADE